jgi:hypothetical protein
MTIPFLIVLNHFFADFLCQTDKMAVNKSKSIKWLTIHACTYIIAMCPMGLCLDHSTYGHFIGWGWGVGSSWLAMNLILHWITDFFTSKLTSYLYLRGESDPTGTFMGGSFRHWFFSVIGADQVIHAGCLFFTYQWLSA